MAAKKTVVVGMLGSVLDSGSSEARWEKWRPTVAVCQQPGLRVHRVELLFNAPHGELARAVGEDIARVSAGTTVRPTELPIRDPWDFEQVYAALHDFARGYAFAPEREDYLVHISTGSHVVQICLFLLTESRHLPARLLQTSPPAPRAGETPKGRRSDAQLALERRERAVGTHRVIDLDLSRYDLLASRFRAERRDAVALLKSGIATRNEAYNKLIARVEQVALASRAPVLLTGPTGAGKSLLARRIWELRRARRLVGGELVEVNCATLRGDGAMSALFGHAKGAFTGAQGERAGLLKRADGGMLFLDEIGELGLDEQAMLLRAIEDKRFLPLGSDREVQSDFLLVAGTNRNLARAVAQGRFREDLLARIDLWTFRLPGLAERREDLVPNLAHELEHASAQLGVHVTMNREAREAYLAFATSPRATWAGNFRDLNASVVRMATLAAGGRIDRALVDEEVARLQEQWDQGASEAGATATRGATEGEPRRREGPATAGDDPVERALGREAAAALDRFDRVQLTEVLRACEAARSLSEAGRALFASSRARRAKVNDADRLRKYLQRFGLRFADARR